MEWSELDVFEEIFYHDLESWFSADIACCDACYDDFIATWPHAYSADDCEFQKTGMPLDCFYSGSRLRQEYSEKQFEKFIQELECPRCGEPLKYTIWPYNLPFDVPESFEHTINEVSLIANETPFLLLKNEFCQDILSAIKYLSDIATSTLINDFLYRGRANKNNKINEDLTNFDFPPSDVVQEGRYNHSGSSALYLASDFDTCVSELRGISALICKFNFTVPIKILDLSDPFDSHQDKADLLNCLVYSALVSAKHTGSGQYKPHYVVSRFTADCAKEAGFDAIKYPSTRRAEKSYNLVILNQTLVLKNYATNFEFHNYVSKKS